MASNVDKLSKFNSAINHYAESQREKILKDIADYQARELEETANNAKIEADRLLVKELAEMRDRIMREMSHREMDSRRELLTKRQEISEKVLSESIRNAHAAANQGSVGSDVSYRSSRSSS